MSRCFRLLMGCLALTFLLTGCVTPVKRVAVLDFENTTNDHRMDYMIRSIPECIVTVMNRHPQKVYIIERQDINRYLEEIDKTPSLDRITRFQQLGQKTGADYLVVGSVSRFGKRYVVQCRLFSCQLGQLIPGTAEARTCDSEEDIIEIIKIIAEKMVQQVYARANG
ncbi:MAG: hypothetical protein NTX50_17285 [Candidatus Sumerlaeota bacterium]|nr:hypothetical protein [Candidatus Sumerlaeota bacterium]